LRSFVYYVKENQPEIAICTHFFPAAILAGMKRQGTYRGGIYTVVTDYGLHKMWLHEHCDRYFVSGEPVHNALKDLGVPARRITVTGIPVREGFASLSLQKRTLAAELNLDPNKFTVLVIASALPGRFVGDLVKTLIKSSLDLNLLLVRGNNPEIKDKSGRFNSTDRLTFRRYDFVERIEKLMGAADVILTKPGGLCITEALAAGTPMILTHPIPDQEVHNADYVARIGAGLAGESVDTIIQSLKFLKENPSALLQMRRQATRHATPQAAQAIVHQILQEVYPVADPMSLQPLRSNLITEGMAQC
jgi:processive 1,2-diacylglycerol beta-glucosyltransferase